MDRKHPTQAQRPRFVHPSKAHGFTLIEVLVAISVMALMSLMAWRGIDGMLRSQSGMQQRADDIRTLQAGLANRSGPTERTARHDQLALGWPSLAPDPPCQRPR